MNMSNKKRWWVVIIYTLLILASLPVARQTWNFIGTKNGFFILVGLYTGTIGVLYAKTRKLFLICIISILAIAVFRFINPPIVRIHFIEYGVLGWLSYWAGGKKAFVPLKVGRRRMRPLLLTGFIYVLAIGILDELIQKFIPNRVFDTKDILMNLMGGSIGFVLKMYER